MRDLKFNELVQKIYDFIGYIESHEVEVKYDIDWNGKTWNDDMGTNITLSFTVPWTDICWGCGELVPRPDHHYGSLGNGWHNYQKLIDGKWVKFSLKICSNCHIECKYDIEKCPLCGKDLDEAKI